MKQITLSSNICGLSETGARDHNEDSFLIEKISDIVLLAVADGLGGHACGECASQLAVDILKECVKSTYRKGMDLHDLLEMLRKAHQQCHVAILEEAKGTREGMATTLVSAVVADGHACIANTGDSRAYVINKGITFCTRDHSIVNSLLENGLIAKDTARFHPLKNLITHSLGGDFAVDVYEVALAGKSLLVLSTDGFHDYSEETLIEKLAEQDTVSQVARSFVDEAIKTSDDNITVVVFTPEN